MAKAKRMCTLLFRLVAVVATLSAAIIMATSREKGTFIVVSYEAKYSDTPALKYFVIANAVAAVYGFLVLFLPSESELWRLVVVLDLVFTMLLTSSISAALAIAQVGKNGNSHAGWLPICDQVQKYCHQLTAALVAGLIALITYSVLLLYAIHTALNPLLLEES